MNEMSMIDRLGSSYQKNPLQIAKLFKKLSRERTLTACAGLEFQAGIGILGDAGAIVGSPRQVLIAGTNTLERFNLQPGDLYENLLVDGEIEACVSGQVVQIGPEVLLRLTFRCEPCATLERLRPGLMKQIQGQRGMLAMVLRSGRVQVGDRLQLTQHQFPALADTVKFRFQEFVARIPAGCVVSTADLLLALGCTRAYYRAIPTFLKQAPSNLPVHRIVAIDGRLLLKYMPDQRDKLTQEGVVIQTDRVNPGTHWPHPFFHDVTLLTDES